MKRFSVVVAVVLLVGVVTAEEAQTTSHVGLSSRAPSAEEIEAFGLPLNVRHQGQVVQSVEPGSPAEKAGLREGDVLLSLDKNDLYSFDDVRDFVSTSKPGQSIKITFKRQRSPDTQTASVKVGERKLSVEEAKRAQVAWEFASLAQLDAALKKAKSQKKLVLVGISGAET